MLISPPPSGNIRCNVSCVQYYMNNMNNYEFHIDRYIGSFYVECNKYHHEVLNSEAVEGYHQERCHQE
jgi:hypothetical protein